LIHISDYIYYPDYQGDEDIFKEYPFFYALCCLDYDDAEKWAVVPLVFEKLQSPQTDKEIELLTYLLRSILVHDMQVLKLLSLYENSNDNILQQNLDRIHNLIEENN